MIVRNELPKQTPIKSFELVSPFIEESFHCSITERDFVELVSARKFLINYMSFEENRLQVLFALQEFEEFLLSTALKYYMFPTVEFDFFQDARLRANTKVLGFLNAITSFKDQFPKLSSVDGSKNFRKNFRKIWERECEASVTFSFCIRLRNFSQHQTQPVSCVTTGGAWTEDRSVMEQHLTVFIKTAEVCNNREINSLEQERYKSVFKDNADIAAIFRETAHILALIVNEIRDQTQSDFEHSIKVYETALCKNKGNFAGKEILNVVQKTDDDVDEQFSIFSDFVARAKRLRILPLANNNHNHFVSNRLRGHEAQNSRFNQSFSATKKST